VRSPHSVCVVAAVVALLSTKVDVVRVVAVVVWRANVAVQRRHVSCPVTLAACRLGPGKAAVQRDAVAGLRIPVATVVDMVADGMTDAEILEAYPDLVLEDIREALRYAAEAVR
jgi:hypothetical protein